MNFLKNLFGNKKESNNRTLSHPRGLKQGDIIKFKFLAQEDLSGKTFEVSQVNSYIYDNEYYPEYVLKDQSSNIVYLMVEEEDGEEYLALSKKIKKSQINEVLTQDQLDLIFKKGIGTKITINAIPESLTEWLVNSYVETEDNIKGEYVKGDAREKNDNINQKFTSYSLTDSSDEYAIEIEIYASNEIELSATIYHEITEIEEMWVGTKNE